MALSDLEVFLQERLRALDESLDISSGSPADVRVIQPLLRRLGTDPYTVDLGVFIQTRLAQEFPELAIKEGDAITDLLIKAAILLWDPLVRENQRVRSQLSFKDPTTLTTEEAESLGANLFAQRASGDYAKGRARIYYAQPQNASVTAANFFSTRGQLHFFPTEEQSVRVEEMLFNVEGSLYYFDVNVVAESVGDAYNIGPDEIVSVSNIPSAVRVTNKARFRFGVPDETAVEFVSRAEQELSERSLVTLRGVAAKVQKAFPEVTRLNAVGFNDKEMQRDVLRGGGLSELVSAGVSADAVPDGEARLLTRRVQVTDSGVDFVALLAGTESYVQSFVLTLHDAFNGELPLVRDLRVRSVIDATTLELEDQVVHYSAVGRPWTLRRNQLTLSSVPGGLLFPDNTEGTVAIPNDTVHVGGATDIYVRANDFDTASLLISSAADDSPGLSGTKLSVSGTVNYLQLGDYVVGVNHAVGDATSSRLADAVTYQHTLQIVDGPLAGSYRVVKVDESGASPVVRISPPVAAVVGSTFRWRLFDELDIDLVEPKETRITASDLVIVQGLSTVDTLSGTDFDELGVSQGDTLRIYSGSAAGDYTVQQVLTPLYRQIVVDRPLPVSESGLRYSIFRTNTEGGVELPLVRITSIDILDSAAQPTGSTVPYALPVDVQSSAFANVARGVKADLTDVILGIVTKHLTGGAAVSGKTLVIAYTNNVGSPATSTVSFTGANPISAASIASQIAAKLSADNAGVYLRTAVTLDTDRVGILPFSSNVSVTGGTALGDLFPSAADVYTAKDVRSATMAAAGGWSSLRPALDGTFDVLQVLDGTQIGFYDNLNYTDPYNPASADRLVSKVQFFPEVDRHAQIGARSLGTARVYFIDPTSFEVDGNTVFTLTGEDGSELHLFPDPTNSYQIIPFLPSGSKPKDGLSGGPTLVGLQDQFESAGTDFVAQSVRVGDQFVVDYVPLVGSVTLADPVVNLNGKSLVVSFAGGVDKTISFIHDDPNVPSTDVTRQGVVDQINRLAGQAVCTLNVNRLEFNPDMLVVVRGSSSASRANAALGFSTVDNTSDTNTAPNAGTYTVVEVAPSGNVNRVRVDRAFPAYSAVTAQGRQQFKVLRPGLQRISSTQMATQQGAAKLYYFDVQLLSEGTGDQYNIAADQQLTVSGYRSDGYYLTVQDSNLTFSPAEHPMLHISKSVLEVGTSDAPQNATQLAGQNLLINYQRSSAVADVNAFALAETERVVNQNPLVRHLLPHFVRFDLSYAGGSKEADVRTDLEKYILQVYPEDPLEVGDLERLVSNRGATSISNPIDLIALVHDVDRSVQVHRSRDRLSTGRLAAFVPDVLTITRRLA